MAENNTLARPYAQALFELASESSSLGDWASALNALAPAVADPAFESVSGNPRMSADDVLGFVAGLADKLPGAERFASTDGEGANFLKLLIENDRLSLMPEIADRFERLKDAAENTVDVTITSATALGDGEVSQITQALKSRLGREVNVTTTTNEDLIGGAVIRAGDFVIDGSVRSQLEKMSAVLSK